jgi:hypothetical protein
MITVFATVGVIYTQKSFIELGQSKSIVTLILLFTSDLYYESFTIVR